MFPLLSTRTILNATFRALYHILVLEAYNKDKNDSVVQEQNCAFFYRRDIYNALYIHDFLWRWSAK